MKTNVRINSKMTFSKRWSRRIINAYFSQTNDAHKGMRSFQVISKADSQMRALDKLGVINATYDTGKHPKFYLTKLGMQFVKYFCPMTTLDSMHELLSQYQKRNKNVQSATSKISKVLKAEGGISNCSKSLNRVNADAFMKFIKKQFPKAHAKEEFQKLVSPSAVKSRLFSNWQSLIFRKPYAIAQ